MDTSANDQNFEVLSRSCAAFAFLSEIDVRSAAEQWNLLWDEYKYECSGDALAVAAANAGVAAVLLRDAPVAREALNRAAVALRERNQGESGSLRGTSSGYHFRLAGHHGDAFENASAARGKGLRSLMLSVVAHHVALLDGDELPPRQNMRAAIDQVFGNASIEALLSRAETLREFTEYYAARADKLRAILRHWPSRARLSPEVAIAAFAILPFDPHRLPANVQACGTHTRNTP